MWNHISEMLAKLGPEALGVADGEELNDPEALVDYEGMLVSVAAAQRRRHGSLPHNTATSTATNTTELGQKGAEQQIWCMLHAAPLWPVPDLNLHYHDMAFDHQ